MAKALGTFILALSFVLPARAATIWTGPNTIFTKENYSSSQDHLTANVWLARGNAQGLFNAVLEAGYNTSNYSSPLGTEWAFGQIGNWNTLSYTPWRDALNADPLGSLGQNLVVHLIADDIYLGLKFLGWTQGGQGGGFSYERSTAAVPVPAPVPVPATLPLLMGGLGLMGFLRHRRKRWTGASSTQSEKFRVCSPTLG